MSFFEQEHIRNEMIEMSELYEEIHKVMYGGGNHDKDVKLECLTKLERLVELQEVLYF
jgi:UDP-2,3-diacylglucosamine pyrophosphatase LpxH